MQDHRRALPDGLDEVVDERQRTAGRQAEYVRYAEAGKHAAGHGHAARTIKTAAVYAPVPKNATWPRLNCPVYPSSKLRLIAAMVKMPVMMSTGISRSFGSSGGATVASSARRSAFVLPTSSSVASIFGTNMDVGKGIADILVGRLVEGGVFGVFERKSIDKIMSEQNLSNSDRADPMTASKIGRLLGGWQKKGGTNGAG